MTATRISPLMLLLLLVLILPLSVCINGCGCQYAENTDDKTMDTAEGNGVPSVSDTAALLYDPLSSAAYNDSPTEPPRGDSARTFRQAISYTGMFLIMIFCTNTIFPPEQARA